MKNLFSKILFSIGLLIFLQNQALAQNIFDELKKAGEQLQKEIDKPDAKQKLPASGAQQPATPKPAVPAAGAQQQSKPSKSENSNVTPNDRGQFTLFGLKLGDDINTAKLNNKSFSKAFCINFPCSNSIMPYSNQLFTPATKNPLFEEYFITYGAYTKKIEGIFARTKNVYPKYEQCKKELMDPYKFVVEKLIKDNPTWTRPQEISVDATMFHYKGHSKQYIQVAFICETNKPAYLTLRVFSYDYSVGAPYIETEYLKFSKELENKQFEKKKDSGELKGL
jgi:hypothetical protein